MQSLVSIYSPAHNLVVIGIDYNQLSSDHDHDGHYSWREQVIRWRGDDICFVLDQCVVLNFKLLANINSNQ